MKKILRKNQIMITALAVMIAVAGYLNFAGTKIGEEDFISVDGSNSELSYEISDEDMYNAAEHAFSSGFNKIKLYTMVGFPTENDEDMEAFCQLIENLVNLLNDYSEEEKE